MNGELATALGLNHHHHHSQVTSSSTSSIASNSPQVISKLAKSDSKQLKVIKPTSNDVRPLPKASQPPLQTQLPPQPPQPHHNTQSQVVQQQPQQQPHHVLQPQNVIQQHTVQQPTQQMPKHIQEHPPAPPLQLQQPHQHQQQQISSKHVPTTISNKTGKLIETCEGENTQDWQTCSSRKPPPPLHQQQQQQHELTDFVSHTNDSKKTFGQNNQNVLSENKTFGSGEDAAWCTFRPIQPEPTVAVCMNNFHSATTPPTTTAATSANFNSTSGFRGGSSRQTAI